MGANSAGGGWERAPKVRECRTFGAQFSPRATALRPAAIIGGLSGLSSDFHQKSKWHRARRRRSSAIIDFVFTYIPPFYPPSMRSTAMAYNFGFGRLGGIFGPTLIGLLMSMNFSYEATLSLWPFRA
jgi:MFS family permease